VTSSRPSGSRLRRKILIVEHHDDVRFSLVEHFDHAGYQVEAVGEGNEAIAAAVRTRPDVIVLDLALPGLDGAHTLAILRSYPSTMGVPVVICTGRPELFSGRALKYSALLQQPCTPAEVERAVNEAVGEVSDADPAKDAG
jgi:CheY-like chemotaxis protein